MEPYSRYLLYRVEQAAEATRARRPIRPSATALYREFPHLRDQIRTMPATHDAHGRTPAPTTISQVTRWLHRAARRFRRYRITPRVLDEH